MTSSGASAEAEPFRFGNLSDPRLVRAAVEQRLASLIEVGPSVPGSLHAALKHALMGQSKRIRPVLMFLVAEPSDDEAIAVLDAGCAVEMVHTASLILDDLPCMDDAVLRRQQPTTHIAFGQSTAILTAIALLTKAFGIIASLEGVPAETRTRLAALLSDAVGWDGLAAGQEIDINHRARLRDADEVENLNWLKTGVLFVAAAETGAILRGLEADRVEAVRQFARHFGLAFQTADDLLDQHATLEQTGKDVGKDSNKATLVSLFGTDQARLTGQQHLAHAERALADSGISSAPVRALMSSLFQSRQVAEP